MTCDASVAMTFRVYGARSTTSYDTTSAPIDGGFRRAISAPAGVHHRRRGGGHAA